MGPKVVVGIVWVWAILSMLMAVPGAAIGQWVFWILVVAHAVECVAFLPKLRAAPGSLGGHLLQTFLFGVAHVRTLGEGQAQ